MSDIVEPKDFIIQNQKKEIERLEQELVDKHIQIENLVYWVRRHSDMLGMIAKDRGLTNKPKIVSDY